MRPMMPCLLVPLLFLLCLHGTQSKNIYGLTNYGRRTVSDRLQALGRVVDANQDGFVSAQELVNWARSLGRPDDDKDPEAKELSCVEQSEFEKGLQKAGFSADFAKSYKDFLSEYSVKPAPAGCSGLDTQAVLDEAAKDKYPKKELTVFLDGFLQKLIDFCEDKDDAHKGEDLYTSNKDCQTLPTACVTAPYGCQSVCLEYTFTTTKDRTGDAFRDRAQYQATTSASSPAPKEFVKKMMKMFQDENGDDTFSKAEQSKDFSEHFDTNKDGCVDEVEFKAHMSSSLCGELVFSEDFATAKFAKASGSAGSGSAASGSAGSSPCKGIDTTLPDGVDQSKQAFINDNVQILIDLCEGDESLYNTNEDCKQLSLVCEAESTTKQSAACKKYVSDNEDEERVQSTAVKFFRFLSKWKEPYENFFGKNK